MRSKSSTKATATDEGFRDDAKMGNDFWVHVSAIGGGLWMALLQWIGIRTIRRVDRLEQNSITRTDLQELRIEFRESRRDVALQHENLGLKMDKLTDAISHTNERLARIEGGNGK